MVSGHRVVLWFRNDLRLTDNAALQQVASMIQKEQASEVRQCSDNGGIWSSVSVGVDVLPCLFGWCRLRYLLSEWVLP